MLVRSDRRRQILTPLQGSNEAATILQDPYFAIVFRDRFGVDLSDPSKVAVVHEPREENLGDALEEAFDQAQSSGAPYVFVSAGRIWELHNAAIGLERGC